MNKYSLLLILCANFAMISCAMQGPDDVKLWRTTPFKQLLADGYDNNRTAKTNFVLGQIERYDEAWGTIDDLRKRSPKISVTTSPRVAAANENAFLHTFKGDCTAQELDDLLAKVHKVMDRLGE